MSKIRGYTTGVFDLFHIGHLNIIEQAKTQCDELIVGVSTDELVKEYKGEKPIIPLKERMRIISALSDVDKVIKQHELDKLSAWEKIKYDKLFHGSDWKNTKLYNSTITDLKKVGAEVVFFEYTPGTSSTILKKFLRDNLYSNK